MKLCKNCKFCRPGRHSTECDHPRLVKIDPVRGDRIGETCAHHRNQPTCGPNGNLWEEEDGIFRQIYEFLRDVGRIPG